MPIVPHDKAPTCKEAGVIIKRLTEDSRIIYSTHSKIRMKERDITTPEIINCLLKGRVTEEPYLTYNNGGGYETTLEKNIAGRQLRIVVCIKFDESLLLITVIEL